MAVQCSQCGDWLAARHTPHRCTCPQCGQRVGGRHEPMLCLAHVIQQRNAARLALGALANAARNYLLALRFMKRALRDGPSRSAQREATQMADAAEAVLRTALEQPQAVGRARAEDSVSEGGEAPLRASTGQETTSDERGDVDG